MEEMMGRRAEAAPAAESDRAKGAKRARKPEAGHAGTKGAGVAEKQGMYAPAGEVTIGDLSMLRAKLLLRLVRVKGFGGIGSSVTQLSDTLGVAKSTVSRAVGKCEEMGLIERFAGSNIMLTEEGERLGESLDRRCREVRLWLESMSGPSEISEDDALRSAVSLSDSTANIIERNATLQSLCHRVGERAVLTGDEFCAAIGDGKYPISIMCYRVGVDGTRKLPSMANDGIENRGELVVKGNIGKLRFKARQVEHIPMRGGAPVKGKLASLKYPDGAGYKEAEVKGDTYCFPASAMNFVCVSGRILQGDVVLRMSCSAGPRYMPESESVMEVFFRV
jgi:Mn-dependent DtxR family transcriptional regulator